MKAGLSRNKSTEGGDWGKKNRPGSMERHFFAKQKEFTQKYIVFLKCTFKVPRIFTSWPSRKINMPNSIILFCGSTHGGGSVGDTSASNIS